MADAFTLVEAVLLTQQALALREAGKPNREIADILHVSYPTVMRLVGKMPKALRKPPGRVKSQRYRLTDDERKKRRKRRYAKRHRSQYVRDDDLDALRNRLAAYAQAELHASTNEALPHEPRDIVASVAAELGGVVEWNGHGVVRRAAESDDVVWRDEEEEEWPEPKSVTYYRRYRTMVLREQHEIAESRRHGNPEFMVHPFGDGPPVDSEC